MAEIIALGLFDQIETKIVQALEAFSTEQEKIDPLVGFDVSQGRMRPIGALPKPLVNVWMPDLNPEDPSSKTYQQESATYNVDLIAKGTEQVGETPIASDEIAYIRLKYLAQQTKHALFKLVNADFGFDAGIIARKQWPRFTLFQTDMKMPEQQIIGGRWTFDVEYAWQPEDQAFVALAELSIEDSLKELWKMLYTYT